MCPPAPTPPDDIGLYWTDEQIILLLDKVIHGSALPNDVYADINPYQYKPSNLPPKIWYVVRPTESKETAQGFWKAKGEACKIYQNPAIYGWRTTLEFFEGPHGRKTDWVMQEYKITQKGGQNEKNEKHSTALCTVFNCCDMQLEPKLAVAGGGNLANPMLLSVPNTNSTSGGASTSESQAKSKGVGTTQSPLVDTAKDVPDEYLIDCILGDNYIELNDLAGDITQLPSVNKAKDPHSEALIDQISKEGFLELDDLTKSTRQLPPVDKAKDPHSEALIDQILKEDFLELDDLGHSECLTDNIDYLELNDLAGTVSHSSSSGNSSYRSLVSDDDFFAVVRNMDDENNIDLKEKDSSYKCRIMGPVRPDEVIMQPAPLGSLIKGTGSESAVEALPTSATNANIKMKSSQTQLFGGQCQSTETNANIKMKSSQTQLLGGQCQSTETKARQSLLPAAKKKFKKVCGVAEKLYCDSREIKET